MRGDTSIVGSAERDWSVCATGEREGGTGPCGGTQSFGTCPRFRASDRDRSEGFVDLSEGKDSEGRRSPLRTKRKRSRRPEESRVLKKRTLSISCSFVPPVWSRRARLARLLVDDGGTSRQASRIHSMRIRLRRWKRIRSCRGRRFRMSTGSRSRTSCRGKASERNGLSAQKDEGCRRITRWRKIGRTNGIQVVCEDLRTGCEDIELDPLFCMEEIVRF